VGTARKSIATRHHDIDLTSVVYDKRIVARISLAPASRTKLIAQGNDREAPSFSARNEWRVVFGTRDSRDVTGSYCALKRFYSHAEVRESAHCCAQCVVDRSNFIF
jgi:hypothetical protein